MTNAEKFLKDGVEQRYFATELYKFIKDVREPNLLSLINTFLSLPAKPILSEDEKVILRNLIGCNEYIGQKNGQLYIRTVANSERYFGFYAELFDFIKERRRI